MNQAGDGGSGDRVESDGCSHEHLGGKPRKQSCDFHAVDPTGLECGPSGCWLSAEGMKLTGVEQKEGRAPYSSKRLKHSEGDAAAKKKKDGVALFFECDICRCPPIPYNAEHIARHKSGKKHQKLEGLIEKKSILEAWGIVLVEEADIKYMCISCNLKMEMSFQKMEQHFKAVHELPQPISQTPSLEVTKVYRRKKFYENGYDFDKDKINFLLVNGSVSIEENTALSMHSVGILKRDVIPESDIRELYGMASILEQLGKPIKRGKRISGSKMVMYGMYEHCQIGWFVQPYPELYALSEKFVMKMAHYFEVAFPEVMANFAKILINEGLSTTEGHFGGTPFTSFAITRDYSCLPHDDPNDYGFGIIVWLYPCGKIEVEEQPLFWLPEYKLNFRCGNGTALIFNAKTTVHCTTSSKPVGVLGMAFVQFRPLLVQLCKALKNPIRRVGEAYFVAKERYIKERDANLGKGVAAIFY